MRIGVLLSVTILVAFASGSPLSPVKDEKDKAPGLPADTPVDKIDFTRYRFHEGLQRYLKVGSRKGCNANMRFFATPGSDRLGECDCDWYECSRPLLYDNKTDQCHWAWSKGPCAEGEWLVYDEKMLPVCKTHPCPGTPITEEDLGSSFWFQNPEDSKCYEAGSKGYCKNEDEFLMISPGEPVPKCRNFSKCYPMMFPQTMQCIQGNKWHQKPNANCTF